jgi:hypothetical protein
LRITPCLGTHVIVKEAGGCYTPHSRTGVWLRRRINTRAMETPAEATHEEHGVVARWSRWEVGQSLTCARNKMDARGSRRQRQVVSTARAPVSTMDSMRGVRGAKAHAVVSAGEDRQPLRATTIGTMRRRKASGRRPLGSFMFGQFGTVLGTCGVKR